MPSFVKNNQLINHNKKVKKQTDYINNILNRRTTQPMIYNIKDYSYQTDEFKEISVRVVVHCGRIDLFKKLLQSLLNIELFEWKYCIININYLREFVNKNKLIDICKELKSKVIITEYPNKGMDTGNFLLTLKDCNEDLFFKLHTKSRDKWRNDLISIYEPYKIYNAVKLLRDENIAMIGGKNCISTCIDFIEHEKLNKELCNKVNIIHNTDLFCNSYFIAGTMFICKRNILDILKDKSNILYKNCNFYDKYMDIRSSHLKMETFLERLFGYLCYLQKQHVIGI